MQYKLNKIKPVTTDQPDGWYNNCINCFYVQDGMAIVRGVGPDNTDISLTQFIKQIVKDNRLDRLDDTVCMDGMDDEDIAAAMCDMLDDGPGTISGVIGYLYMSGWVAAELRQRLKAYEGLADLVIDHAGAFAIKKRSGKDVQKK